jgi:hypothetical protein
MWTGFDRSLSLREEFSVVIVYTTCQPEHGVADDASRRQAKLAVDSRAFPVLVYDPRAGDTIRERLSLRGNPALRADWYAVPKTGEEINIKNTTGQVRYSVGVVGFARTEFQPGHLRQCSCSYILCRQ